MNTGLENIYTKAELFTNYDEMLFFILTFLKNQ